MDEMGLDFIGRGDLVQLLECKCKGESVQFIDLTVQVVEDLLISTSLRNWAGIFTYKS